MYSAFLTQTLATAELDKYYTFEGGFSREQVAMLEKQVSDSNIQMNEADGGHYDWHMDTGPDQFSRRKISITVQLSDPSEYEGGDLQLKINSGHQNTPKGFGTVVIFPSYLLHRVTPVTGGLRKSLVLWITGPAFK